MPPPVPNIIQCTSSASLDYELRSLQESISVTETEDSWDAIARAIQRLTALCRGGACDFPRELIAAFRSLSRPLTSSINSERSRLSGAAIDLLIVVATGLERAFDPLIPLFFPVLVALCTRPNKLYITRARACIWAIIEHTQLPSMLPFLREGTKDKSISLRLASTEAVLRCLNCFNPPDLEKEARAEDIEVVIRVTARDPNADVRKASRKVFEAYQILLPHRVDAFVAPLTPITRKYLDIKAQPASNPPSRPHSSHSIRSNVQPKPVLSSSTSSLPSTVSHAVPPVRPQTHGRAVSASSVEAITSRAQAVDTSKTAKAVGASRSGEPSQPVVRTQVETKEIGRAERVERGRRGATKPEMPPPDFIPVRPTLSTWSTGIGTTSFDTGNHRRAESASSATSSTSSAGEAIRHPPSRGFASREPITQATRPPPGIAGGAQRVRAVPVPPPHRSVATGAVRVPTSATHWDGHLRPASATDGTAGDGVVKAKVIGGARRVPLPPPPPNPEEKRAAGKEKTQPPSRSTTATSTKSTGSTSGLASTAATTSAVPAMKSYLTRANEKPKPIPLPTSKPSAQEVRSSENSSSASNVPGLVPRRNITSGVTQPTLSQLARIKPAVTARKPDDIKGVKTNSGRSAKLAPGPPRAQPIEKAKSALNAAAIGSSSFNAAVPDVVPEAIPLPPSPTVNTAPALVPLPPSPTIEVAISVQTPKSNPIPPKFEGSTSPEKTPISALVSAIERGFIFSPSPPLSPLQSYNFPRTHTEQAPLDTTIPYPPDANNSYEDRRELVGVEFGFGNYGIYGSVVKSPRKDGNVATYGVIPVTMSRIGDGVRDSRQAFDEVVLNTTRH